MIPASKSEVTPFLHIDDLKGRTPSEWKHCDRVYLISAAKAHAKGLSQLQYSERVDCKSPNAKSGCKQKVTIANHSDLQPGVNDLMRGIVRKLEDAGREEELALDAVRRELLSRKLVDQPKRLTEKIWKKIGPELEALMSSFKKERLAASRYQLISALDVALWEPFRAVIEDLRAEAGAEASHFDDAARKLPQSASRTLPKRTFDSQPLCFAAVDNITLVMKNDPSDTPAWCFPAPSVIPSVASPTGEMEVCAAGVDIGRTLGRFDSIDMATASISTVMSLNPLVECKGCTSWNDTRLFLRWSAAVQHEPNSHEFTTVSEEDAAIVVRKEHHSTSVSDRCWSCKRCLLRDSLDIVQMHIKDSHDIQDMTEHDWEYFPLGPLPYPESIWSSRNRVMAKKRKAVASEGQEDKGEVEKKSARRRRSLQSIMEMPMDVLFEILGHLKPYDLLRLTWTSKKLRQILMSKTSTTIWKTSRTRAGIPDFNPFMSEPALASLLFHPFCGFCHTAKVQKINWGAFVRCCKVCSIKNYCTPTFAAHRLELKLVFPSDLWKTLPYLVEEHDIVFGRRVGNIVIFHPSCTGIVCRIRQHFFERKRCSNCQETESLQGEKQELKLARASRFEAIISKLEAAGWAAELANEESREKLSQHKLVKQPKPLTERIWKNISKTLLDFMAEVKTARMAEERLDTSRKRFRLIDGMLRSLEMTMPRGTIMPLDLDVAFWEPFRTIIEDLPVEAGADLSVFEEAATKLPQFIEDWNQQRREECLRALRAHQTNATEEDLHLATSLFRCTGPTCKNIYSYPAIISHHCRLSYDESLPQWSEYDPFDLDRPFSSLFSRDKPASDGSFERVTAAAQITRTVCQLHSLDPSTTSSHTMVTLNPFVECKTCNTASEGDRALHEMDWGCLSHSEKHDFAAVSKEATTADVDFTSSIVSLFERHTEMERRYRCKHCNFRDGLHTVENHLKESHNIAQAFDKHWEHTRLEPLNLIYAVGLLFLSPLGDLVRRRQLILALVILSTALTIGLAVTNSIEVFIALSFLVGVVTVTPQILLPLAADLAPAEKRASAISVVFAGLLLGILMARVIAGIIGQYVTWRVVYYLSIGLQAIVLIESYLLLPDYPAKNFNLTYFDILWSMAKYCVTEPILIQACLVNIASSALFNSFWVTLTFLLGGEPYHYSTLTIGLFGLIGICGVAMGPLIGRIIDKLIPWYASIISSMGIILFMTVQVIGGGLHISAVIITTVGLDLFRQTVQTSLSTNFFSIAPEARARLNAVNVLAIFVGQVMGTSVGTKVFIEHGWRAGAGLQLALAGWALFVLLLRGPHCSRYTWLGYEGGIEARKSVVEARKRAASSGSEDNDKSALPTREKNEKDLDLETGNTTRRNLTNEDEKKSQKVDSAN
ncbi:membrane protein [Moniliophthora roreri]|nr:membrane protein [Moniliophthora roreri]